eukprot:scaffold8292_cov120-Isochrysis_galbana.AAC.3
MELLHLRADERPGALRAKDTSVNIDGMWGHQRRKRHKKKSIGCIEIGIRVECGVGKAHLRNQLDGSRLRRRLRVWPDAGRDVRRDPPSSP